MHKVNGAIGEEHLIPKIGRGATRNKYYTHIVHVLVYYKLVCTNKSECFAMHTFTLCNEVLGLVFWVFTIVIQHIKFVHAPIRIHI